MPCKLARHSVPFRANMPNQETKQCQNCQKDFTIEPEDFDFYAKIKVPPPTFCPECRLVRRMSFMDSLSLCWRTCGLCGKRTISRVYSNEKSPIVYCNKYWWSDSWDPLVFGTRYNFSQPFFEQFKALLSQAPHPNLINRNGVNSDYCNIVQNAKNCYLSFGGSFTEDTLYSTWFDYVKSSMDSFWSTKNELCYETIICKESYGLKFSAFCIQCDNSFFLWDCRGCSNCFGCVGLRGKQHCILNKQYSKEEYEALAPKIIQHMSDMPYIDKKGRVYKYGEFFPAELSPFCYNETIAQEYFPLSAEAAAKAGYNWKQPEPRNYKIDLTCDQLPDNIKDVPDDIIGKVIECANAPASAEASARQVSQCTEAFKIIEPELAFYRRMNLPLPRTCPNCRHYQRLKQCNPLRLWTRQCMAEGCPNTFQTSYAPDRPEIVYREACYLKEVV